MLKQGTTQEGLFDALSELDACTRVDSVLTSGQDVTIQCQRVRGKFVNWTMFQNGEKKPVKYDKGLGYDTFFQALNDCVEEHTVETSISVMCYMGVGKKNNGKVNTRWAIMNPTVPFEIIKGKPMFETIDLEFSDEEYAIVLESRMALYNEYTGEFYPIREVAFSSIGKLLDIAASFRNIPKIPLGQALLIASRFATDAKELKFICRNVKSKFKPLIGIAGSRFTYEKESGFFEEGIACIERMFGMSRFVGDWTITDEMSTANIYVSSDNGTEKGKKNPALSEYSDFPVYIQIQTSDIPGVSASVTAIAKIGKGFVMIRRNSAYHWDAFVKRGGVESLFSRTEGRGKKSIEVTIKQDIDEFVDIMRTIKERTIVPDDSVLQCADEIAAIVGMRRMNRKDNVGTLFDRLRQKEPINAYELYIEIINETFHALAPKQWNGLAAKYYELANKIMFCAQTSALLGFDLDKKSEI